MTLCELPLPYLSLSYAPNLTELNKLHVINRVYFFLFLGEKVSTYTNMFNKTVNLTREGSFTLCKYKLNMYFYVLCES